MTDHQFTPERTNHGAYFSDCSCGWSGGVYPSRADAKRAHIAHVMVAYTGRDRLTSILDEVRDQVRRGALCPMCSTGITRQTVGMVCQLCGTDYGKEVSK